MAIFRAVYNLLWGDIIHIPLPGGSSLGLSLLVLILVPAGIYFTIRTRFLPFRMFPEMIKVTLENNKKTDREGISGVQALIVSTACRVGMGNLVGVVAAISAGGAGAVFWMWVIALVGSSTAFIEATLAQIYKEKDPLYGGYRGGPAYYIHHLFIKKNSLRKHSVVAVLFALSGLICWCGISQVIGNSISSSFENAFHVPPIYSTVVLVVIAAVIVLRKNATVKVLDVIVPIMAACYFFITIFIIVKNAGQLPAVFERIFAEAFGFRQVVGGGLGAVIMNGAKRGLFSNEAGSGSAPCAAAAADISHPAKEGLLQALGVFIDTLVICSCSAMIMLLTPESMTKGLEGMDLLQTAMQYHLVYRGADGGGVAVVPELGGDGPFAPDDLLGGVIELEGGDPWLDQRPHFLEHFGDHPSGGPHLLYLARRFDYYHLSSSSLAEIAWLSSSSGLVPSKLT